MDLFHICFKKKILIFFICLTGGSPGTYNVLISFYFKFFLCYNKNYNLLFFFFFSKGYEDVDMDKFKHGVMPEFWENIMNYILANSTNTEFLFRYGGDEHEVLKLEAILRDDPSQLKFSGDGPNVLKIQNQHSIAQLFKNLIKYYKLMSDEVCIAYRQFEGELLKSILFSKLAT